MYFQVCSNSTYPQHSGERYRTSGPLVFHHLERINICSLPKYIPSHESTFLYHFVIFQFNSIVKF